MNTVRIRPLRASSSDEVDLVARRMRRTLMEVLGEQRGGTMYSMDWLRQRVRFHLDPKQCTGAVFLAEDQDRHIIGHTIVRVDGAPAAFGLFSTTWVNPASRRKEVASQLLARGEQWMRSRGLTEAKTYTSDRNHKLIRLYERHGYSIVQTHAEMVVLARPIRCSPEP